MGRCNRKNTTMTQRLGEKLNLVNTSPVKNINPVWRSNCQASTFYPQLTASERGPVGVSGTSILPSKPRSSPEAKAFYKMYSFSS